jgi:hypothetical protein
MPMSALPRAPRTSSSSFPSCWITGCSSRPCSRPRSSALPPRFLGLPLLYLVVPTAYSTWLKRPAVLDVLVLAGLYTLRVLAGGAAGWLESMGGASGYPSVLMLALYLNSEQVVALYQHPILLWLMCPLLLYWTGRLWLRANRGEIHEKPSWAPCTTP